jgi:hypothetical protein
MNIKQFDEVCEMARRFGISFDEAAERFMLHGTGEQTNRERERAEWNARIDAKKRAQKYVEKLLKNKVA